MKLAIKFLQLTACIVTLTLAYALLTGDKTLSLQFRWSAYTLLWILPVISSSALIYFLNRRKNHSPITFWYTIFNITILVWAIGQVLEVLSANPATYAFVTQFSSFGYICIPLTFLLFCLHYTGKEKYVSQPITWLALYGTTAMIIFTNSNDKALIFNHMTGSHSAWGYNSVPGPYNTVLIAWILFNYLLGTWLLLHYASSITNLVVRMRQRRFIFTFLAPLAIGIIADGILPLLGYDAIPLALLSISVSSLIIGYSIIKHSLFKFSAASNVVANIDQGVVGINLDKAIEYVNKAAEKILNKPSSELLGLNFTESLQCSFEEKENVLLLLSPFDSPSKPQKLEIVISDLEVKTPISLNCRNIFDGSHEPTGYVVVITNLADDKKSLLLLAQQTNELQRSKLAMMNLLEDAKELETDITTERDRITTVMNSVGEGLIVIDSNGIVDFLNPIAEKLFHVSLKDVKGKSYESIYDVKKGSKIVPSSERPLNRTLREGKIYSLRLDDDITVIPHKGTPFAASITTSPLKRDGKIDGAVGIINDITTEKHASELIEKEIIDRTRQASEARTRLESSINSLNVGFIMTGEDNEILTINAAASSILFEGIEGISPPKIISIASINSNFEKESDLLKSIEKATASKLPVELKSVNYYGRFLRIFIAPIISNDGDKGVHLGSVILIENKTEQIMLERSKDEFFSIASHELRTPLTAIRGNTSLIQNYYSKELKDPDLKEMIGDIYESSVRLIGIVNDFLDATRLEQGKMKFEYQSFVVEDIIQDVVDEMESVGKEKGVSVGYDAATFATAPLVYADKNRTKQVVYNLLGNSLKFTEKGQVSISLSVANNLIKILVADTGLGMDKAGQELLFQKFKQTSTSLHTRDTTKGTGLGLFISKQLVERMGGTIQLESSIVGKGSVFSFTVPIATEKQQKTGITIQDEQNN